MREENKCRSHTGTSANAKAHTHFLRKDGIHSPRAGVDHLEDFCLTVWMAYFYYSFLKYNLKLFPFLNDLAPF